MQVVPRVRKMFGRGCGEFKLIVETDKILVPVDGGSESQVLLACLYMKVKKMPVKPELICAHFHTTPEPDAETKQIIEDLLKKCPGDVIYVQHDDVENRKDLLKMYIECAIEHGCNKVALSDSANFMNATLIGTMCKDGVFNGPDPAQPVQLSPEQPSVTIIRPFCYLQESEIESFVRKNKLQVNQTGIHVPEEKEVQAGRKAIDILFTKAANIHVNIFNSQYQIQDKYLGAGDGSREVLELEEQ